MNQNINDVLGVFASTGLPESTLNELDAIQHTIFELLSALETERRKLTNIVEDLAELLDARPVPAVLEFEEVDR